MYHIRTSSFDVLMKCCY